MACPSVTHQGEPSSLQFNRRIAKFLQNRKVVIRSIIKIMGFPLDDNFVFGDNFFSWLIIFFSPKATKKNTQPRKKNTHQQTKLLIQRKHHYTYDMTFLCHLHPLFFHHRSLRKKLQNINQGGQKNIITQEKKISPKTKLSSNGNIIISIINLKTFIN